MDAPLRTLVIAASPEAAGELTRALIGAGLQIGARRAETVAEAERLLSNGSSDDWDLVLCEPGADGDADELLGLVRDADSEVPVVMVDAGEEARSNAAEGVLVIAPGRPGSQVVAAVRREVELGATRRAARLAAAALDLRDRALASAGNGIVIGDAAKHGFPIVYVNPAWERTTGWSAAQALGQSCAMLQGPGTDPGEVARITAALRAGEECHATLLNYRADGSKFWNALTLSPIHGQDGAVTHVVGVLDDVTEQRATIDRLEQVKADNAELRQGLTEAEARYRELVEQIPAVTYVAEFDEIGTLRWISPQVGELLGLEPEALMRDPTLWERLIHPEDRERVIEETARVFRERAEFDCEYRMVAADGREVHLWEQDTIVRDSDGEPLYTQGVILDITPLREAEVALREERDRAQSYLDVAGTIIVVLDQGGRVVLLNRTGHALLGYADGALIGRDWFETCVPAEDREAARGTVRGVIGGDTEPARETLESRVLSSSGETRDIAWRTTVLRDERGEATITARRRAEEQIAHLAYHDVLTGLPNRALLHQHLEHAIARGRRNGRSVALLYLDLDDFKLVNDSFGHAAGDELLHQVAQRLSRRRRAADLLARQGGDEFLLLISDIEDDALHVAVAAAEGMLSAVSEPFAISGAEFHLGASIGLSVFPRDAPDADTLLRHADRAMYQAKAAGRGHVRPYSGGAVSEPLERLSMTSRLRRAIAQDEFVLHWQPIFGLESGGLYGLEALLRWEDPQRGRVPPLEFIGVAEETGLIDRIGEWVAEAVCRQRLAWQAAGVDPIVTLNVSPRELRRADFAERLLDRLGRHGLDPARMVVELTETAAMAEQARAEPLLERLAAGGIRVAIDDFGAGYSSLARLRELPVDVLKVERRFLTDVPDHDDASAVVTAILDLGAALGMDVVVEGVETDEQRAFLLERGCRLAQGFLLGRPAPAAELGPLLRGAALPV